MIWLKFISIVALIFLAVLLFYYFIDVHGLILYFHYLFTNFLNSIFNYNVWYILVISFIRELYFLVYFLFNFIPFFLLSICLILNSFLPYEISCFFFFFNFIIFNVCTHFFNFYLFLCGIVSYIFSKLYFWRVFLLIQIALLSLFVFIKVIVMRTTVPRFKLETLTKLGWSYGLIIILVALLGFFIGYYWF